MEKGFTLPEVLVALALMCAVSLIMAKNRWQSSRVLDASRTAIRSLHDIENAHEAHHSQ